MHTNKSILDVTTPKHENLENLKKAEPLKTTSAVKLMVELYKVHGMRSLYRGGTLLFIRFRR